MHKLGWSHGWTEWYSKRKQTNPVTNPPGALHIGLVWLKQYEVTVHPLLLSLE